jgi:hypothetical protein
VPLFFSRARVAFFTAALGALWLACWSCQATPRGDAALQLDDLAVFERDFFAVDRSYAPAAREEAERRIAVLRANPGGVSDARFVLALAEIAALADNAHTVMVNRGHLPETARVGIRLAPFGDDFVVVRARREHADLLGGRLLGIDEAPIERLRESARTLRGGIPAWRDRWAPILFERPGELHALDLIRSAAQATYRFQLRDGTVRSATLVPDPDSIRLFTDCHDYVRKFPIAVTSLAPDVPAPWTIDAYAAGQDPAMDAAARVLQGR